MKTIALTAGLLLAAQAANAQTFPQRGTTAVVDAAHVLTLGQAHELAMKLENYQRRSGHGVVVATIPSLQGYPVADYGYRLGRAWGVSRNGSNDGAVLLLAPTERKARLEIGYGLEGQLTDAQASVIVRDVIAPKLRIGDTAGALNAGVDEVMRLAPADAPVSRPADSSWDTVKYSLLAIGLIGGLSALILSIVSRRRRDQSSTDDDWMVSKKPFQGREAEDMASGQEPILRPATLQGYLAATQFTHEPLVRRARAEHTRDAAVQPDPSREPDHSAALIAGAALAAAVSGEEDVTRRSGADSSWIPSPTSPPFEPSTSSSDSGSTGSFDYGGGSFGGGGADTSY